MKTLIKFLIFILLLNIAMMCRAQVTVTIEPTNQSVTVGGTAYFYATISSNGYCGGQFTGQWLFNGTNIPSIITTVAGNGTWGYSGDGGPGTNAELTDPNSAAFDAFGNLYIGDGANNVVRKLDTNGIITTVAGGGTGGGTDGFGDGGPATNATFNNVLFVSFDPSGNYYIADQYDKMIRKVDTNGIISVFAGGGDGSSGSDSIGDDGPATNAVINNPTSVTFDYLGNAYISDNYNSLIRKVDTNGIITIFAGTYYGYGGDGGPATNAQLSSPNGLVCDALGNLYISDSDNDVIRMVDTNGYIWTVAGNYYNGGSYTGDGGAATNAGLNFPNDVWVDIFGNIYIADNLNNAIREVDGVNGIITTVAGDGVRGYSGDGGAPTNAEISAGGVSLDAFGNLYIFGSGDSSVRKVSNVLMQDGFLAVQNATANDSGTYQAVISSPCGSVTSIVASLTVSPISTQSTNLYVANFGALGDARELIVSATSNSSLYTIISTNWGTSGDLEPNMVFETFSNGPVLYQSNDPSYFQGTYYGHNTAFQGAAIVQQQDIIGVITNAFGNTFRGSIPSGFTGNFICIIGTNNAPMLQAAINSASNLVANGPWTNVNIHLQGYYLCASTDILNASEILPYDSYGGNEMTISSGGITLLGDGSTPSQNVILSAGAGMDHIFNNNYIGFFGGFMLYRDTTFLLQAPCQNYQYPLVFNNITIDGGCVQGQQDFNFFPPTEGIGEGWDTSHHAVNCNSGPFNTPGYAQYNEYVISTNCVFQHFRGEIFIGQNATTGTNDWISWYNCQFLDGNATADNYNFGQNIINCTFDGVGKVMEYYQSKSTENLLMSNCLITNISELAGPGNVHADIGLTGGTTNMATTSVTFINNRFYDNVGMEFVDDSIVENFSVISNVMYGSGPGINMLYGTGQQPSDGTQVYYATNTFIIGNSFACAIPLSTGLPIIDGLYCSYNTGFFMSLTGWMTNGIAFENSGANVGNADYDIMGASPRADNIFYVTNTQGVISGGQFMLDISNNWKISTFGGDPNGFNNPIDGGEYFNPSFISYGNGMNHMIVSSTGTNYLDDYWSNQIPDGVSLVIQMNTGGGSDTNFFPSWTRSTSPLTLTNGYVYTFTWDKSAAEWTNFMFHP